MRLDSVRGLKSALPLHLEKTFAKPSVVMSFLAKASPAVAEAASRHRRAPSYFLGVARKGKGNYRLAVRLQDRALEKSALVAEIAKQAKGEVDVRYVGQIRARAGAWYRTTNRPLLIGTSVGFLATNLMMAGTLGCFVKKQTGPELFILSNNHVLADENRYPKGGHILQAGSLDGGQSPQDRVAKLADFVKLDATTQNLVDCAIAETNGNIDHDPRRLKGIGTLAGLGAGELDVGATVHKVGRTTGARTGKVTAIELDGVTVGYDIGLVSFDNQIEIEGGGSRSFSDAGDSGSLIVDDEMNAAALLFAGGEQGGTNGAGVTYGNPIAAVLSALKVELVV